MTAVCENKLRTAQFRAEIADKAGGMYSSIEVAELLGIAPAAVDKQREQGQILGVPYDNEIRFPASQFKEGAVILGLEPVLEAFGDMNPWGQLQLLVAPIEGFGAEPASILSLLTLGIDDVTVNQLVRLVRSWAV